MNRHSWIFSLLVAVSPLQAADNGMPVAQLKSPIGTVLEHDGAKGWLLPKLEDSLSAGVSLVTLPGARGVLLVKGGDLRLLLAGNLPELPPSPVLESAITLQTPESGYDLEFTLDRGRIVIECNREKGAKVRARIQGKSLNFDLLTKDSSVALELISRWPAGTPFAKKPKEDRKPLGTLIFLVAGGKADVEINKSRQALEGPVLFQFNTEGGLEGPLPLKKVPEWVKPALNQPARVQVLESAVEKLRFGIADKGVQIGLAKARHNPAATLRAVAALSGVALDHPAAGIAALKDQAGEVRRAGISALLNYIGRGNTQDVKLYESLLADNIKPGQAGIIMELLHGLSAEALARPEIYDTLITYLQNDQIAIRELAGWNLERLVPKGKAIAFDAAGTAEERSRAQAGWRKLIPEGKVP
jgi:hypothetical protein